MSQDVRRIFFWEGGRKRGESLLVRNFGQNAPPPGPGLCTPNWLGFRVYISFILDMKDLASKYSMIYDFNSSHNSGLCQWRKPKRAVLPIRNQQQAGLPRPTRWALFEHLHNQVYRSDQGMRITNQFSEYLRIEKDRNWKKRFWNFPLLCFKIFSGPLSLQITFLVV